MATRIDPVRFDRRRGRLAAELVASLDGQERRALALAMRHTVSGRWSDARGAVAVAVLVSGLRGQRPRALDVGDLSVALTSLVLGGWIRVAGVVEGRGHFWCTDAAESITHAAGVTAVDLDPTVPV